MAKIEEKPNHAEQNAKAWMESITEMVAALDAEEYPVKIEGDEYEDADGVRERIQESILDVSVRDEWYTPGHRKEAAPEEFTILLTTGGPALRIRGELNEHTEPKRAWLEYQDWGTPWTQYFEADTITLLTFCQQFYFGE